MNWSPGAGEVSEMGIVLVPCLPLSLILWSCYSSDSAMEALSLLCLYVNYFFFLGEHLLFS